MKEKILALLLAKFAGVRKDGLAQLATAMSIQAADETEATALVEKITADKVNDFVKDWRKDVDKEVSDSKKTIEDNLKKKYDFVEKKGEGKKPEEKEDDDVPAWAKALVDSNKALQDKLAAIEGGKTTETRLQLLQDKFKAFPEGNKLAESFTAQKLKDFKRMNFESDEAFNEYLTELDTDVTSFNQGIADMGLSNHGKPFFGSGKGTEDEQFAESMKAINSEESK